MSDRVERDPKAMHQFVKEWESYEQDVAQAVRDFETCCQGARGVLKDAYVTAIIDRLEGYSKEILQAVQQGDERIRELERSAKVLDEIDEGR